MKTSGRSEPRVCVWNESETRAVIDGLRIIFGTAWCGYSHGSRTLNRLRISTVRTTLTNVSWSWSFRIDDSKESGPKEIHKRNTDKTRRSIRTKEMNSMKDRKSSCGFIVASALQWRTAPLEDSLTSYASIRGCTETFTFVTDGNGRFTKKFKDLRTRRTQKVHDSRYTQNDVRKTARGRDFFRDTSKLMRRLVVSFFSFFKGWHHHTPLYQ